MIFVSVTRLRVRSLLYLPQFLWRAFQSISQSERSPGFLGGKLLREARNAFWTITSWNDAAAMNAFRVSGAHRAAMPSLLEWCDEASVAHWTQETAELPAWLEVHRRMVAEGKQSKVNHPSPDQTANRIPAPKPSRIERELKPAR
jgi:Antibiotic biosynthesis monooxygenase